jgi:hypothetical protein
MRNRWGLAGGRLLIVGIVGALPGGLIGGLLVGGPVDAALNNGAVIIAVWLAWFGALAALLTARPRKAAP